MNNIQNLDCENLEKVFELASEIRRYGYAVVFFTKDELEGIPSKDLESALIEYGNNTIQEIKEEYENGLYIL